MKKNYFLATLLILAIAVNSNAQFVELDDKEPVFHLTFDDTYADGKLMVQGTDAYGGFEKYDGTTVEEDADTIRGHGWGGGDFNNFTYLEQVVDSDDFSELFLPTMFWPSFLQVSDRPQGIAAYTDGNGAYAGPRGTSPRTITTYLRLTDSARVDTANGAWDGDPMLYQLGKWDSEGGGGWIRWTLNPSNMKFQFDWGLAADFSPENAIEKNEWVHLALTIPDGGARADVKFYINGVAQDFVAEESTGPEVTTLNTRLTPAVEWDGIFVAKWANVWMADYRVYDAELSEVEVRKLLGLNPISAPKFENQDVFNIYPVPNNGIFTIETTAPGVSKVVIRNTLGQVVHNQIVDQKEVVDVSSLSTGMYFVTLSDSKNTVAAKKILIK